MEQDATLSSTGAGPVSKLLSVLELERLDRDLFRAWNPPQPGGRQHALFGGQVAAHALRAATLTIDAEHHPHSLHGYFLRPGKDDAATILRVDRIRDGRSFTTRRVVAVQHGKAIFNLSASFQIRENGLDHQGEMPEAPDPETLPTMADRLEAAGFPRDEFWSRPRPIDVRYTDNPPWLQPEGQPRDRQMVWMRADGTMSDNPLLHVCAVTYASDMTLLDSVLMAHGLSWQSGRINGASLDHAMWFHRPFRADDWLLYVQESPTSSGARGLSRGELWTRDGQHVVSVVQEGLLRVVDRPR